MSNYFVHETAIIDNSVKIGDSCKIWHWVHICAGTIVTKDVKPHTIIVSFLAKQIYWVSHAGKILKSDLICPREGRKYKIVDEQLIEIK